MVIVENARVAFGADAWAGPIGGQIGATASGAVGP